MDPNDIHALLGAANSLAGLERHNEAEDHYKKALKNYDALLKSDPHNISVVYMKGFLHYRLSQHRKTIGWFDRVLQMDPNHVKALKNKGTSLASIDRFEESLECFKKILKINPDDEYANRMRKSLYETLGV